MSITIENKTMVIQERGEKITVTLDPDARCATVTNGHVVPLTINVSLALKVVMHAMKNDIYTLDELYALFKLSKRKLRDTQEAQEMVWGVGDDND